MELPKYIVIGGKEVYSPVSIKDDHYLCDMVRDDGFVDIADSKLAIPISDCKPVAKHIFTFGCGQEHAGRYQPIFARDAEEARHSMVAMYGSEWCWQYTEEQWDAIVQRPGRWFEPEKPLSYVVAPERD